MTWNLKCDKEYNRKQHFLTVKIKNKRSKYLNLFLRRNEF